MPALAGQKLLSSAFTKSLLCLRKGRTVDQCRQETGLDLNTVRFCSLTQFVAGDAAAIKLLLSPILRLFTRHLSYNRTRLLEPCYDASQRKCFLKSPPRR